MQGARIQVVAFLILSCGLCAPRGEAQCCGDCDADGQVAVAELVTAVNRALAGCLETERPAATPTPTSVVATPTAVRFVDNEDGTISDSDTGLMWEKKVSLDGAVDGFELHDADNRHPWRGNCTGPDPMGCQTDIECPAQEFCNAKDQQRTGLTIFQWLVELNRQNGSGFAGFNDWRIPTIEELRTLRDSAEQPPATHPAFHAAGCETTCVSLSNPACSCTSPDPYWSATVFEADPTRAWRVDFLHGDVLPNLKLDQLRVRAVRP